MRWAPTKAQRVALFLAMTCLGSWSLALAFHLSGGRMEGPSARFVSILYVLVPGFMAVVVRGALARLPLAGPLGLKPKVNRWLFIAWGLPVVVLLLAFGLYAALPGYHVVTTTQQYIEHLRATLPHDVLDQFEQTLKTTPPPHPALLIVEGMLGGVVNVVFGLGEELGWRGFLMAEIEAGFWRRSFITGLVWGAWLVPLVLVGFLYPEHSRIGAGLCFVYTLLWSPALVLIRARSGTVWAPALARGTIMALSMPAEQLTVGGDDLTRPFAGVVGLLATAAVVMALVVIARRPVRSDPSPAAGG